ncbi:MAG: ATPase, T2SS/T4P/T4SS family [Pirellulales bacterium]
MAHRRIGQVLVDMGFITDEQQELLVDEQREHAGQLLGKVAIDMGLIHEDQLVQALAEQLSLSTVAIGDIGITKEVLAMVTAPMAQMYRVIPVEFDGETLTVATCDPQNLSVQDELRTFLGYNIRVVVASESALVASLERYYGESNESVESIVLSLEEDEALAAAAAGISADGPINLDDVTALADSAPVRKLLNMVLLMAIREHASDLHFEPFEDEFKIRIKADGVLYEMVPPPRHLAFAITTRIKVMANLDIAERRLPQDGRIELTVGGHPVDLRISVLPTMFGESVCMRVLDRSVTSLDLASVGMNKQTLDKFRDVISKPNGIVLVTGPTGCGKTTTLYSALNELNSVEDKLITTEDPVEYDMEGIIQVPIDAAIGNTFAHILRSILRQDPDKILVGEIRDLETAEIAVQASLTGHLVFSTLHTNDAPSTITRLKDMGVPTFLITATIEAILAQRLVRKVCMQCREEYNPPRELLEDLELTSDQVRKHRFYRGAGCEICNNTGYKGRVGLFELMIMSNDLRDRIMGNAQTDELRELARKQGMVPLREAGVKACFDGITTPDEVVRETILEA